MSREKEFFLTLIGTTAGLISIGQAIIPKEYYEAFKKASPIIAYIITSLIY